MVSQCVPKLLTLPKFCDRRGNLSFIEGRDMVPFDIERVYWINDIPGGKWRDGHAFYSQQQLIVALSGSFEVITVDPSLHEEINLLRTPDTALFLPQFVWRRLENFSTNAVALVVSSELYNPDDYIDDFQLFKSIVKNGEM